MRMSERAMRVPEVARMLGVDGTEVYGLIEQGELEARKGPDGLVYVTDASAAGLSRPPGEGVSLVRPATSPQPRRSSSRASSVRTSRADDGNRGLGPNKVG